MFMWVVFVDSAQRYVPSYPILVIKIFTYVNSGHCQGWINLIRIRPGQKVCASHIQVKSE